MKGITVYSVPGTSGHPVHRPVDHRCLRYRMSLRLLLKDKHTAKKLKIERGPIKDEEQRKSKGTTK
jgi:hypothetical protein